MKTVLLNLIMGSSYGRGILRGIASYTHSHTPWILRNLVGDDPCLEGGIQTRIDGIIAHISDARHARRLRRMFGLRTPIVDVGNLCRLRAVPAVHSDDHQVGRMAAEHFLERGFRHLACYTYPIGWMSLEREAGFARRAAAVGIACHRYEWPHHRPYKRHPLMLDSGLRSWVADLPKPVGILASNDSLAFEIMETCQLLGARVPEEVAVLGVNNYTEVCDLATPPLSSIEMNTERIGYEAARLLDRFMAHRSLPKSPVLVAPTRVIMRQSTDIVAVTDQRIAAAVRFIRHHAHEGIRVHDVLRAVPMARRTLETGFRQTFGRSPLAEIRRMRIERAKDLLERTDLPVEQVADRCGFKDVKRLYVAFRPLTGMTPARWRRLFRLGRTPPPPRRPGKKTGKRARATRAGRE